jgi:hypothetical protein
LVAVKVYTVGEDGDTSFVPDKGTVPTPRSIKTDVAPVTSHANMEDFPAVMLPGSEVKLTMTGIPDIELTVTVVETKTEPELFVAFKMYEVVTSGDTDFVPDDGILPIP